MKKSLFLIILAICSSSCMTVKQYQKIQLNDPDMKLKDKNCDKNLLTMHAYREAASGGNGGKTGGGCGCN